MNVALSIGSDTVSLYYNGDFYSVDKTHTNYESVMEEIRKPERNIPLILELMDVPSYIARITSGRVVVADEGILFEGNPVSGYMVGRMMEMLTEGLDLQPWAAFMDNLMDNPLPSVRDDLYKWMEVGRLPITADGCLIGFKKVRANYTDVHTGRFSNAVGAMLEMDRSLCDTNRKKTCSTGFHFCSAGYLSSFGGEKVMVVKINPRDVTAIPSDYNDQKARCCRYTVTGELTDQSAARHRVWTDKKVVDLTDPRELPDVLLPREGSKPSELSTDASRVDGPAPVDDWAIAAKKSPSAKLVKKKTKTKPTVVPEPAAAKPKRIRKPKAAKAPAPAPETSGVVFSTKTASFTEAQVRAALTSHPKISDAAKSLGVPRTTLTGWSKKLA